MRISRLTMLLGVLAVLAACSLAGSSAAAVTAPTGLHGFLLTANEAPTTTFHRTPSFAWKPMRGAVRYEFQLATAATFRENGILVDISNLQTPVAGPTTTLPWITGSPHSLYARVRAFFAGGHVSPWSADYGFDVVPPSVPTPMSSDPGLLRWTPVDGADRYDVWLVDTGKIETVDTNVLDEREYFAFHNSSQWIGAVHWRVRAQRLDTLGPKNGLPVAWHGPWSPIYTSTNPAPTTGPIVLNDTISDTVSNGSAKSPAHSLAPAFTWSGDETLDGAQAQFFRVYVFTDSGCINRVYSSPIIASPAYAPRLGGPLALPTSAADITAAQKGYLPDGSEANAYTLDGDAITSNEQEPAATPTTSIGSGPTLQIFGNLGAPVDLWDTNWPSSGYYWTVIPVAPLVQQDGSITGWQDLELAQDVCAAGRVARFGISSQPGVTRNHEPFASGLSSRGKLVSATKTNTFYGQPLIAWKPVLAGWAYEVQWAKKAYPFAVRGKQLTTATSLVLPLKPGTWYYRVRGYDYNLPTGTQEMAWSAPVKIVVAAPKFRILSASRR